MKLDSFYLGVVHYVSFPEIIEGKGPFLKTLEEIFKFREVKAVEISWIHDKEQRNLARSLLGSWGGEIVFAGSPMLALTHKNLSSLDESLRKDSVEIGKRIIDEACYFGAYSVLFISGEDPGPKGRKEAKARLVDSILEVEEYARACSNELKLTLEPADRDIHRRQLLGPINESVDLIRILRRNSAEVSLTIDMSHLAQLGEDKEAALRSAKGFFHHVHIANAIVKDPKHPRFGDEHPRFGIEGGEHDEQSIVDFINKLKIQGFFRENAESQKPIISIEVKPDQNEEPTKLMEESINTFLRACAVV